MTSEHPEDSAQIAVTAVVEQALVEHSLAPPETPRVAPPRSAPASGAVLETAQVAVAHDSAPPMSRKLVPPPKPKRDPGTSSSPPPANVSGDLPDLLALANALKSPIEPALSFTADAAASQPEIADWSAIAASVPANSTGQLLPPAPQRSESAFAPGDDSASAATAASRTPSQPALGSHDSDAAKPVSNAPRPLVTPPRPRTDSHAPRSRSEQPTPGGAPAAPEASASVSSAPSSMPPSSSAIFAMRIIAVGESVRPHVVSDQADNEDPNAYPTSASRLGTGVRRSSRPAIAAVAPAEVSLPAARPPIVTPTLELDLPIDIDLPIDVELPATASVAVEPGFAPLAELLLPEASAASPLVAGAVSTAEVPPVTAAAPSPVEAPLVEVSLAEASLAEAPLVEVPPLEAGALAPVDVPPARVPRTEIRPPPPPPPEELSHADASPRLRKNGVAGTDDAEELDREDAISMPAEELAAFAAEHQARADAAKPPPPPKRALGTPPSASPAVEPALPAAREAPTPDPAAAKAAQRSKTRQPWWEDLFNEDFMRASSRVSDEHIRREVTFIEDSLGVAAGGVVLDLGCGAGHHAVELASRGYGVVGYDLSLYQLALAADVAQERSQKINFLQGDMREMAFEEMFDGVFCWNTTFGYFEEDKNLAVAQRVFKALRPGGMFLIDVLNRDFAAASAPCTVWYEGDACVCMDDMSVDYISSRLRVKRSIILDDGRTKESLFSLRLYSLHELGKLLHEVGFRVTEASGHVATPGVFFGPNSPRIIILAQKP